VTKKVKVARALALAMRVACDKEGDGKGGRQEMATRAMATMWAMTVAMRLVGSKEDKGEGGKGIGNGNVRVAGKEEDGRQVDCNGIKEGDGDGNKGGGQATAMGTKRTMAMATRVVGDKEGNDDGGKSDGDGNEGGG
jgi:hypothetical protein